MNVLCALGWIAVTIGVLCAAAAVFAAPVAVKAVRRGDGWPLAGCVKVPEDGDGEPLDEDESAALDGIAHATAFDTHVREALAVANGPDDESGLESVRSAGREAWRIWHERGDRDA